MNKGNENGEERPDARKTSGATRRIVVQDFPAEEPPPVQGRKLAPLAESPTAWPARDEPDAVSARAPRFNQPNESRSRTDDYARPANSRIIGQPSPAIARDSPKSRPSDPNQINIKRLLLLVGGMVFVLGAGVGILLLIPTPSKKPPAQAPTSETAGPPTQSGSVSTSPSPAEGPSPSLSQTDPPKDAGSAALDATQIRSLSEQLAVQISQKGGYAFAPEFIELIRARTLEYTNVEALGGARLYKREINKAFRDEGMNPLVGYVLAMSRSKFDLKSNEKGYGIWQIPPAVARSQGYLVPGEKASKLNSPETSAENAANYTKALFSNFDPEEFMYAIACFGMSLQEAGLVQARLLRALPDPKSRRDIMKTIRAGVLTADQVDSIARFFAAGIVGENPQKFGLVSSQSFSSLY
jgi:hypothetical protein